ncbi:hypothetical protein [Enterobacter cloacae]
MKPFRLSSTAGTRASKVVKLIYGTMWRESARIERLTGDLLCLPTMLRLI